MTANPSNLKYYTSLSNQYILFNISFHTGTWRCFFIIQNQVFRKVLTFLEFSIGKCFKIPFQTLNILVLWYYLSYLCFFSNLSSINFWFFYSISLNFVTIFIVIIYYYFIMCLLSYEVKSVFKRYKFRRQYFRNRSC